MQDSTSSTNPNPNPIPDPINHINRNHQPSTLLTLRTLINH